MDKIIVIGASGHAKVIIEAIELSKSYHIHGLIDSFKPKGGKLFDYEILGTEDIIPDLQSKGITKGIIAIGDNWTRFLMHKKILSLVPDFDAVIGEFCIVNTYASFGHDGTMGDFSSLAPGVIAGGNVKIGFCSAICLGANIIQGTRIGEHSIVGAGALVLSDVADYKLMYGVPGNVVKSVKKGEKYL